MLVLSLFDGKDTNHTKKTRQKIMNSKQRNRTMNKAFGIFLIAALLVALVGSTIGVTYASDGAGNALDFDGDNDYVKVTAVSALKPTSQITLEAWVKVDNFYPTGNNDSAILDCAEWTGSTKDGYAIYADDDAEFMGQVNGVFVSTGPGSVSTGVWYHVALTYDHINVTLYVNGVLKASSPYSSDIDYSAVGSDDGLNIGKFGDDDESDEYDGLIDEARIWDTALDQSTIQDWMHGELATAHPNKANLIGYWKLNDGSGTTATDSSPDVRGSGSANNGTLQNMEDGDWVTSTAPIGDTTVGGQNDIAAMWANNTTASSSGLIIANSTFLQDIGDDIVFGHNNASGTTPNDCPSGVSPRWQRVWYLDKTDVVGTSGGNVNLTFDFGDAGFGGSPSGNYTLLRRSGETGDFTGIVITSTISGDQVIFNNVDVSNLGSYFTLGEGTPTAVTLARFAARPTGRDLTGFGNLPGLGALVALGAGALVLRARRRGASKALECPC